jgi:hypothetical protein
MHDKYELTLSTFPKVIVYQPAGNIMAYPTPSGEAAILAFRNEAEANAFVEVLSASGKVSGPCRVVNLGVSGWLSFGESLGVRHVAIVVGIQNGGRKIGVVPMEELLEAAREYAPDHSRRGQDGAGGT